jgi:hypothetical protein
MHATVRHFHRSGGSVDDLIPEGRQLASAVSQVSGFLVYVLLDAGEGLLVSVSLFEDQAGLADADGIVERWMAARGSEPRLGVAQVSSGEVIVQRGM